LRQTAAEAQHATLNEHSLNIDQCYARLTIMYTQVFQVCMNLSTREL
jgi:hypothetical protein